MAGILGVNPEPFTIREIAWMIEGKGKDAWNKLSSLMALIANCNRVKGKAFLPKDFNPYSIEKTTVNIAGSIEDLKMFLPKGKE